MHGSIDERVRINAFPGTISTRVVSILLDCCISIYNLSILFDTEQNYVLRVQ